jgi:hypothetical protein
MRGMEACCGCACDLIALAAHKEPDRCPPRSTAETLISPAPSCCVSARSYASLRRGHHCAPLPPRSEVSIGTFVHHRGRVSLGSALVPPPLLAGFRLVTAHRAESMPHRSAGASHRAETVGRRREAASDTERGSALIARRLPSGPPPGHTPATWRALAPRRDQAERTRCSSEATRQRRRR